MAHRNQGFTACRRPPESKRRRDGSWPFGLGRVGRVGRVGRRWAAGLWRRLGACRGAGLCWRLCRLRLRGSFCRRIRGRSWFWGRRLCNSWPRSRRVLEEKAARCYLSFARRCVQGAGLRVCRHGFSSSLHESEADGNCKTSSPALSRMDLTHSSHFQVGGPPKGTSYKPNTARRL